MKPIRLFASIFLLVIAGAINSHRVQAQDAESNPALDEKVRKFLTDRSGQWYDMNIPARDGQLLYDLIIKGNYKNALEIGTSTGHSGIWIAWALSKTGGKLLTIEIDPDRHREAMQNFREAGLSEYIDARLGDAHELVKQVKGPFDFVFSDADKNWYKNYFTDIDPKLKVGGCYTTHNVYGRGGYGSQGDYLEYVRNYKNYESTLVQGMLISYKRAER
jgi:predicted O-methyltransferase YrrM